MEYFYDTNAWGRLDEALFTEGLFAAAATIGVGNVFDIWAHRVPAVVLSKWKEGERQRRAGWKWMMESAIVVFGFVKLLAVNILYRMATSYVVIDGSPK